MKCMVAVVVVLAIINGIAANFPCTQSGLAASLQNDCFGESIKSVTQSSTTVVNVSTNQQTIHTCGASIQTACGQITALHPTSTTVEVITSNCRSLVSTVHTNFVQLNQVIQGLVVKFPSCVGGIDVTHRSLEVDLTTFSQLTVNVQSVTAKQTCGDSITSNVYNLASTLISHCNNIALVLQSSNADANGILVLQTIFATTIQIVFNIITTIHYGLITLFQLSENVVLTSFITAITTANNACFPTTTTTAINYNSILSTFVASLTTITTTSTTVTVAQNQATNSQTICTALGTASTNLQNTCNSASSQNAAASTVTTSFKTINTSVTSTVQTTASLSTAIHTANGVTSHSCDVASYNLYAATHVLIEQFGNAVASIHTGVDNSQTFIANFEIFISHHTDCVNTYNYALSQGLSVYILNQLNSVSLTEVTTIETNFQTVLTDINSITTLLQTLVGSVFTIVENLLNAVGFVVQNVLVALFNAIGSLVTALENLLQAVLGLVEGIVGGVLSILGGLLGGGGGSSSGSSSTNVGPFQTCYNAINTVTTVSKTTQTTYQTAITDVLTIVKSQ